MQGYRLPARSTARSTHGSAVPMLQWRRQKGNLGVVRVFVPGHALATQREATGAPPAITRAVGGAVAGVISQADLAAMLHPLEEAVAALREQLAAERSRADSERARADALRDRLDEMQARIGMVDAFGTERSELQTEIDVLRRAVAAREAEHASANAKLAEAQAEAERHAVIQTELHAAQAELRQVKHEAQEAQEAAEALRRADDARKARGRLRRAWDGWRGR
jgi:DNA repair exonuclease SbcCD ATPase subunit